MLPRKFLLSILFLIVLHVLAGGEATLEEQACDAAGNCDSVTSSGDHEPVVAEDVKSSEMGIDPHCPDRGHLVRCASKYLDKNRNGKIDRDELQAAIDGLPWYARGILKVLGSVDRMMKKCDVDGDDAIGMDYDMEHNKETCLATCFKRRAFKGAFFPDCDL